MLTFRLTLKVVKMAPANQKETIIPISSLEDLTAAWEESDSKLIGEITTLPFLSSFGIIEFSYYSHLLWQ
jgi:hypothetical protein